MSDIRYNSWLHRSGTGGVYQDSSGNVGIGTSTAGAILHTRKTSGGETLRLQGTATSDFIRFTDGSNSSTGYIGQDTTFSIVNQSNTDMRFKTNDTERVRITSAGKFGVNTSSPEGTLSVDGNIAVSSSAATVSPSGYDIKIRSSTSKLGIHCVASDGTPILEFGTGGSTGCCIFNADATPMRLGTVNTERMRIRGDGRISIGSSLAVTGVCTALTFVPTEGQTSHKNLLINGNMQVAQRGDTFTNVTGTSTYCVDRFLFKSSGDSVWSLAQSTAGSVLANTGFAKAIKVDCTTTDTSLSNTNEFFVAQRVEAKSLQHLRWGNAAAVTLTLSFWTRSNKTGDYGLWFYAQDGARQYATTYTISSADTWEKKVIIIPGDSSGTINNDTGPGFECRWYLGAGSSYAGTPSNAWTGTLNNRTTSLNLADSTSNEWYLTGAQLEVGSVATPFEVRSYGEELARCQRYYYTLNNNTTTYYWFFPINNGNYRRSRITYPVTMRAAPTVSGATGANNGTVGTPTGTQHVDIDHTEFHWDVSNAAHLVDLRSADFSSEL